MSAVPAAPPLFAVVFVNHSYPITDQAFTRVDATHWVLDVVSTVTPNFAELKEAALFLLQPNSLDPAAALGLYVSVGGAEWQYRGYVSNSHPSEVVPLNWPKLEGVSNAVVGPGTAQLGVSLEPLGELVQKEGSKLASREEFAKRVALDLFRYMESFSQGAGGSHIVVPTNILESWFKKFDDKFRRDPEFLTRGAGG